MNLTFTTLSFLVLLITGCGKAPDMPRLESASIELLDGKDETRFYLLPLKAEVSLKNNLWSDDRWKINQGSINLRWNTTVPEGFYYESPRLEELLFMLPEEMAKLSPAEKFDLYMGRYEYPLKEEVSGIIDPKASDEETLEEGWIHSTFYHAEPLPKTVTSPDGLIIPFGSSDIKALLNYHYKYFHEMEHEGQLGRHCPEGSGWFNWNRDCKNDLNAGAFHVVLTNRINRHETFMVDIDRYKKVMNRPVSGFVSRVEEENQNLSDTPLGTAKILIVRTKVSYVDFSQRASMEIVKKTPLQQFIVREYRYKLYLNPKGQIIGGEWISDEKPDFLWTPKKSQGFTRLLKGLEKLLNE